MAFSLRLAPVRRRVFTDDSYISSTADRIWAALAMWVLSHFLAITARALLESNDVNLPLNVTRGRNAFHRFPNQAVFNRLSRTEAGVGIGI
jgi:hypothetical protein